MTQKKKVCLLGAYGVGKTSLVRRFVKSMFDEKYLSTIGVKVDEKQVSVDGADVLLMVWDIAGAENKFSVPSHYVRGSDGYLLVIDGTRAETLERALEIVEQIEHEVGDIPKVTTLNKCDLVEDWELSENQLAQLDGLNAPIFRSSAKTGEGVEEAFAALTKLVLGKHSSQPKDR